MKPARAAILLHPLVLLSLFILLVNDCFWKYEYHNWLTGKLSDLTGLIVLAAFLNVFFSNKKAVIVFCSLFFIWWKSGFSQGSLNSLNHFLQLRLYRTIDYSDLICLIILPLVFFLKPRVLRIPFQRMVTGMAGIACLFAFCNTTMPYRGLSNYYPRDNEISFYEQFPTAQSKEQILEKLQSLGISCYPETERYYPIRETELFYREKTGDSVQYIRLKTNGDSGLFLRRVTDSFYVIPVYIFNGDTLRNVEFSFHTTNRKKKPYSVHLESFQTTAFEAYEIYQSSLRKRLKKGFEKLFE
jgi:hypothetical protein